MTPIPNRQRGAVAIMVALAMLVLLAVAGLVVDGGLAYMVKARLNAAVDSAALAAARAVPVGSNEGEQTESAQKAAARFFAANIPAGYLLSEPRLLETKVTFDAGTVTIDVSADAPMKLSLMRVLGFTSLAPRAFAQTVRKDLDMAFVVDTSGSLKGSGPAVQAAARSFLNKFNVTQDRVGLVHFANGAVVDQPIETSKRGFRRDAMLQSIASYRFDGGTSSVEGMWHAREQLKSIAASNRSSLRVIVFFSDGEPTSLGSYLDFNNGRCRTAGVLTTSLQGLFDLGATGYVPISANCSPVYDLWKSVQKLPAWYNAHNPQNKPNDPARREFPIVTTAANPTPRLVTADIGSATMMMRNVDRAARNLAEAVAARARDEGIIVFTLGLGSSLKSRTGVDNEIGENILKCMANVADGPARCYNPAKPVGMYCHAATEADLTPCFSRLASAILRIAQ